MEPVGTGEKANPRIASQPPQKRQKQKLPQTLQRNGPLGCELHSMFAAPNFIGVPLSKPHDENRRMLGTRRVSTVNTLPKQSCRPRQIWFDRSGSSQGKAADHGTAQGNTVAAAYDLPQNIAVIPFVVRIVPGTTRQHLNESRLPCREHRPPVTRRFRVMSQQLSTEDTLPHYGV